MKISNFSLKWFKQPVAASPNHDSPGAYFEYYIDGRPLPELLDTAYGFDGFVHGNNFLGLIPPPSGPKEAQFLIALFSGEIVDSGDWERIYQGQIPEHLDASYSVSSQVPIYTCPCGDIQCGGVVISIEKDGNLIIWDFGEGEAIGPFYFEKDQYWDVLKAILEH